MSTSASHPWMPHRQPRLALLMQTAASAQMTGILAKQSFQQPSTARHRQTGFMGVQATRTAEEARMAEENMAAVRSALADMLSHGGGFAGEITTVVPDADSDCHRTPIGLNGP